MPLGVIGVRVATVHSAKGHEFEAMMLAIPTGKRTDELVEAWGHMDPQMYVHITGAPTRRERSSDTGRSPQLPQG